MFFRDQYTLISFFLSYLHLNLLQNKLPKIRKHPKPYFLKCIECMKAGFYMVLMLDGIIFGMLRIFQNNLFLLLAVCECVCCV